MRPAGSKKEPKNYAIVCNPTQPTQVAIGLNTGVALMEFEREGEGPPPATPLPPPPLPPVAGSRGAPSAAAFAFQMGDNLIQVRDCSR